MRFLSSLVVLALLSGCDVDLDSCETFLYVGPTVVVMVQDAQTGAYLTDGVTVTAADGAFSERLELAEYGGEPPRFEGVPTQARRFDEVGAYTVTVVAEGYETASASSGLDAVVCSGTRYAEGPAVFDVELVRAAP